MKKVIWSLEEAGEILVKDEVFQNMKMISKLIVSLIVSLFISKL